MLSGESDVESGASAPPAVQGVPYWSAIGQQQLQTLPSNPVESLLVQHPGAVSVAIRPLGFVQSHNMQPPPPQILGQTPPEVFPQSDYEVGVKDQHLTQPGTAAALPPVGGEFLLAHTELGLGNSIGHPPYSYTDPYYTGIVTAYGAQTMMHPHILGVLQSRMPLPSEVTEEEPVYVNAKQYQGILRRRQSRAKAEAENKLVKFRKPYLHESRHKHAMKRPRGCGGRFLNTKTKEETRFHAVSAQSSGQCSQRGNIPDSEGQVDQDCTTSHSQAMQRDGSMVQSTIGGAGQHTSMMQGGCQSHHQNQTFAWVDDDENTCQNGGIMANGSQQVVATQ